MSVSENISGLPVLSWIWDCNPWLAALIALIADFGMVCGWMYTEGVPARERTLYWAFCVGNTIFLPLFVFAATKVLTSAPSFEGWFFTKGWWHAFVFFAGAATIYFLEHNAVRSGQFTSGQELSPSKMWHTGIAVVVFYWAGSTAIPILMTHRPWWALCLVFVAFFGYFGSVAYDNTHPLTSTANTHFKGKWFGPDNPFWWHRTE